MGNYDDIINLPHHKSKTRKPMSAHDRAAQFAPFAALTGYDALVDEAARYTDRKIQLSEDEKYKIDLQLQKIRTLIKEMPEISITFFVSDEYKQGGMYVTVTGRARKLDDIMKTIIVDDEIIALDDILVLSLSSNETK